MEQTELQQQLKEIRDLLISNKKVLNLNEIAEYIGYSKSHIYKLTSTNQIPHYKPNGKVLFFDKNEVDTWLLNNKVETRQDIIKKIKKSNDGKWGLKTDNNLDQEIMPDKEFTDKQFTKSK